MWTNEEAGHRAYYKTYKMTPDRPKSEEEGNMHIDIAVLPKKDYDADNWL